jgi:argininosuccinate lyase
MAPLWSGRFDTGPDRDVFAFGASLRFDRRLVADDVTGSIAWAGALADAGVIQPAERDAIVTALRDLLDRVTRDPSLLDTDDEDVHTFVERELVAALGDTGRRLHTGRSRNEQVALDLRLYVRRRIGLVLDRLRGVIGALAGLAESAGDAIMPAYTHLRRAQPVLVAHYLLAHAEAFRRDHQRFAAARAHADAMPLGSGAVAGASYPIDTAALARRLGFSRVVANSIDATADRDFVADFLYAAAMTLVHLSRVAEDLILFTSEEFGFFELADAVATGSSLMPQKKNPDPLELIRGKTGREIGHLCGWLATLKGLPSGYNKDLQEDKEALFDAETTLLDALGAARTIVGSLQIRRARMEAAASGLLLATDVAEYLVARGLPFRRAHEVVGGITRELAAAGRDFAALSLDEWRRFSPLFDADIVERLGPKASVAARRTPQSTAPEAVAAVLHALDTWLQGEDEGAATQGNPGG